MGSHISRRPAIVLALVTLTALAAVPSTAHAASTGTTAGHCVASLAPAVGGKSSSITGYRCFASFSKAMTFASKGRIELVGDADPASSDAALRARARQVSLSNPLLGIEYNAGNFGGSTLTLTGTGGSGCYGGTEYSFGNLGAYGWNDKIESARAYSNCVGQHFKNSGLSGASTSVFGSKADFGSLRNETSSIRFY